MTPHRIDFTRELVTHLRLLGVRGIRPGTRMVHPETAVEPPADLVGAHVWDTPVEVGAFTYFGHESQLSFTRIGRYCSVAKLVQIGLDRHPVEWLTSSALGFMRHDAFEAPFRDDDLAWERKLPVFESDASATRTTTIGNDVWIGSGACIRDGVAIGDGAVIGAMSVVTRDVPPYAIVAGAPARVLRMRFPDAVIERMLAVRWWQYNLLELDIDLTDPMAALDRIEELAAAGLRPYAPAPLNLVAEARRFRQAQRLLGLQAA